MKHACVFFLVALTGIATSKAALAEPTKQECAAANESAQDLRSAGKLREARVALAVCTAASCPGPIRDDCAQQLNQVEAAQPTVVLHAKNDSGQDLTSVRVTLDGTGSALADTLDGVAVPVDPGKHRFTFESSGFKPRSVVVVVSEGEHDRSVQAVLEPQHPATMPGSDSGSGSGSTRRTLGLVTGGTGLAGLITGAVFGIVAKSTYDHALHSECGGDPSRCTPQGVRDGQTAHDQATMATVGLAAGAGLLAGGAVLFLTAPNDPGMTVGGTRVTVGGSFGKAGGGLALSARW